MTSMEMIFISGILLLGVTILVVNIFIFQWLAKRNSLLEISFKKAFLILLIWWLVTAAIGLLLTISLNVIGLQTGILSFLVNTVIGLVVFYFVVNKFSPVSFLKALKIYILYVVTITAVSLLIVVPIRGFLFSPFVVSGVAMNPTFQTGDYLIVEKIGGIYERGDIVVYEYESRKFFIQRIIGLPGEMLRIKDGEVFINNEILNEPYVQGNTEWQDGVIELENDEYFMMGDNREHSRDSRLIGVVSKDRIFGEYLTKLNLLSTNKWVK